MIPQTKAKERPYRQYGVLSNGEIMMEHEFGFLVDDDSTNEGKRKITDG
jgi:hypothetical protein